MSIRATSRTRLRAAVLIAASVAVISSMTALPAAQAAPQPMAVGDPSTTSTTPATPATPGTPATPATPATPGTTTTVPLPKVCTPKAPWRLNAQRDANDPTLVTIDWVPVECATRYNVSVFVDGKDTVTVVDGATTKFSVPNTDPAKTYRIQVGSRNDAGLGLTTPTFYLRPSVPGGVTGMRIDYSDVTQAVLTWSAPADRQPISYHLTVTRLADRTNGPRWRGDKCAARWPGRPRHLRHHPPADQQGRHRPEGANGDRR
jgi:hypothetical protein